MKTKLILVEGIPGSGKTTISHLISEWLLEQKIKAKVYQEGGVHPANLDSYAVLTSFELDELYRKFPEYEQKLDWQKRVLSGQNLILIRNDFDQDHRLEEYLKQYSIWDNHLALEQFEALQLSSWEAFANRAAETAEVTIFDCAFLQDHVTELLAMYQASDTEILSYFTRLSDILKPIHPILLYLQQENVEKTLNHVAFERVDESGTPVWAQAVSSYIEQSPYGMKHHLQGLKGMIDFYKERKRIDHVVLKSLPFQHLSIDNDDYDWEKMKGVALNFVHQLLKNDPVKKIALIPERIQKGDTIGIASPSHIVTDESYEPIFQGIMEHGFLIRKPDHLYADTYGYSATEWERGEDFNQLIKDNSVKMIFFGGGDGAIEVLPYIDYNAVKRNPKIFLSYSDGTSILNAIYIKTGLITYYGQTPDLFTDISEYNEQQFVDFCMIQDVREMKHNSEWKTLREGCASGILIGGYLTNFALLIGSKDYQPDLTKDYILFLEDHEMFFGIPYISAILSYIEQSRFMPRVKGLLFGHYSEKQNEYLLGKLTRIGARWNIPVCSCDDFGHGANHAILAIGSKVTLDADAQRLIYEQSR